MQGSLTPDLSQIKRVLILRLGAIGDVVHALPVAAALKEAYPHLEITWVVEELSADIVRDSPCIHETLVLPRARWKQGRWKSPTIWREQFVFFSELRRHKFDLSLDLQGYAKTATLALAARAPYRFGWFRQRDGARLVSRPIPRRPQSKHRVDIFLDVVRALGVETPSVHFPIHIPDAARYLAQNLLAEGGVSNTPYIVVNASGSNPTRRWSAEDYAETILGMAQKFELPSVLVGSQGDVTRNLAVLSSLRALKGYPATVPMPIDLAGKTNLKALSALLEGCALHLSVDTGSTHIAAAFGCPVVGLYGPSDVELAGPWGQTCNAISRRSLCAAGCSERTCAVPLQRAQTLGGTSENVSLARCLASITPHEVLEQIGEIFDAYPPVKEPFPLCTLSP